MLNFPFALNALISPPAVFILSVLSVNLYSNKSARSFGIVISSAPESRIALNVGVGLL